MRCLIGPSPLPTLADQAASAGWPFHYLHFPDETLENEYFNPAIVRWRDKLQLIVRRRQGSVGTPGRNTLEGWTIEDGQPRRRHHINIPTLDPKESFEDPRAFVRGENLILSYCSFLHGESGGFAHQAMTGIHPGWIVEQPIAIEIGQNGTTRAHNKGHEKNWTPFLHEGSICISYSLADGQHTVVATRGGKAHHIHYGRAPTWPHGTLRGGSCPVEHAGLLWTFYHSSHDWYCRKRRYHMGVLAFQPKPPFNVVRMARKPLLSASELDFRNQHAPPCVWPGGAVLQDDIWTIALGVNDHRCAIVQVLHSDIEKACYVTC